MKVINTHVTIIMLPTAPYRTLNMETNNIEFNDYVEAKNIIKIVSGIATFVIGITVTIIAIFIFGDFSCQLNDKISIYALNLSLIVFGSTMFVTGLEICCSYRIELNTMSGIKLNNMLFIVGVWILFGIMIFSSNDCRKNAPLFYYSWMALYIDLSILCL